MPLFNSFPASSATSPENNPPVSPNNFNYSMSQGGYISARMTNHSRSALPPRAVVPSGYSRVIIAERMAGIRYAALSNLSNLVTETEEEFCSPSALFNDNMITLPPPAPRANDFIQIQQTFRALMPSDFSQLQPDSMVGISRAALYNFSDHFAPRPREMVSSPCVSGSNNNISSLFPWAYSNIPPQFPLASMANIPIAAQQTSRHLWGLHYNFSAQQTSRAIFSSYFACESSEIVTTHFSSSNIISAPPPTAPRLSDFFDFLRTTTNNSDLLRSSSNPLPSRSLPDLDHSGLIQSTDDLRSDMYCCSMCPAMFPSPQALGGHMSKHSKEKRKRDRLNAMPSTSRGRAKNVGGSAAYESSSKKKIKREC